MKNSIDTIGNQIRGLLACSAVPQPTAPQRAPHDADKETHIYRYGLTEHGIRRINCHDQINIVTDILAATMG